MGRIARIGILVLAVVLAGLVAQPAWAAPPLPSSMAAIGDSITRAYDVCCSYGDHPGQSWSTGSTSYDGITSHYERIRQLNSAITGRGYNDAVTGAKMSAAPGQATQAVGQGARYVTILLGANDLCTSSPSTMTSTTTFRAYFSQAMATLLAPGQDRYVFVSSIPNIYQLWQVLHGNSLARTVWAAANICQSMLGVTRTEAQRQQVVDREKAFNQILAEVCASYSRCRWDNKAVYNYQFSASQVSSLDFFHPSLSGQAALARVTWGRVLVVQQLTEQADPAAVRSCVDTGVGWARPSGWAAAVGRAVSLVNPGAWVVTRSGRRVRPGSAADSGFTPSL
jgi:lysophospholipase L1-like esterase